MNNREEFEKFCRELYNTGLYHKASFILNYPDLVGVKVDAEYMMYKAWQHQQKIIDELKAENFALSAMVCKHPDKRIIDENYDSSKDYCDMLKADNPYVPCPECGGKKYDTSLSYEGYAVDCNYCKGKGKVSTVKALQYENEQLENKIKYLQDSAQKCFDTLSKYGI